MIRRTRHVRPTRRAGTGFSLLEVMIVLAILGIILSLAVPSYRQHLLRSNRVAVIARIMQVADCQERALAFHRAYAMEMCLPEPGEHYALEVAPTGDAATGGYLILARPIGLQARDRCGYLALDQVGTRFVGNADADIVGCWAGR